MIERYEDKILTETWSLGNKAAMWQEVELAVILARVQLGQLAIDIFDRINDILRPKPVDIKQWLAYENELKHDLNAFIKERKKNLPEDLRRYVHDGITSYDTEEPAFARILSDACTHVLNEAGILESGLIILAKKYCFTPMNARTHGQEAEMQSFGARCLTWLVELRLGIDRLGQSMDNLKFSRLSGAIGKYGAVSPELEEKALGILGLKPFYGATQIAPRGLYLPTAQALSQICQAVDKIALDIRLMARSGKPLVQEPFSKLQTGSSAMPQKKNTINTEKIAGMARLAKAYARAIEDNLSTWEERAIEQSSCERIAWPDLTHVTSHAIQTLTKVLKGLKVYPDNMLWEIVNSRGCYAAGQAKDWLKEHGVEVGIDEDSAYRIVQLAAFNAHRANLWATDLREAPIGSLDDADRVLSQFGRSGDCRTVSGRSIWDIIQGGLRHTEELAPTAEQVEVWNKALQKLFLNDSKLKEWYELFQPSYLLRNEPFLFQKIIGWTPGTPE
jgi:adenylosuccinate lyase